MIDRAPGAAARDSYDLLVVGGGIYGIALVLEAARRGARPLLLERRDFGGATSWNSLRIVHGGLRYLQSLDLRRFHESVGERSRFLREFPDLIRPLACLMPLYGEGPYRPGVLRAALAANDLLSSKRNRGIRADRAIPGGRVLTREETLERFPTASPEGLRGGALWFDGAMTDSQRLLVEMLHWAVSAGAVALNYVEADGLLVEDGAVTGIEARDHVTGERLRLRSPRVVNCAGPWCRDVAERFGVSLGDRHPLAVAFNLLLDREPLSDAALALRGARTYFLHPWKGGILAGTYHAVATRAGSAARAEEAMVASFVAELNGALPGFDLRIENVLRVHQGLLPTRAIGSGRLASREWIHDHASDGGPRGLFSVSGVKFTTARLVAERTLERLAARTGLPLSATPAVPRPEPEACPTLAELEALLERDEAAAAGCVRRLVAGEAVLHLDDLLLRRTEWGADPRKLQEIAARVARLLPWNDHRIRDEMVHLQEALA